MSDLFHVGQVERDGDDRTTRVVRRCVTCAEPVPVYVRFEDFERFVGGDDYIQNLFPYLTPGEQEMLISGVCDPCFQSISPPDGE